jgi:hypothetical protein
MAQYTWSVKIETVGGRTVFTPNPGPGPKPAAPGDPLTAQIGDGVSWRNDTGAAHVIWRTDGDGGAPVATVTAGGRGIPPSFDGLMSNPIAPDSSSSGQYFVADEAAPTTIYYCCLLHPNEKGSINVVDKFE